MIEKPNGQETRLQVTQVTQVTKKPENLRANAVPVDGFVLSVDGKLKTRYETAKDAEAAGAKLKQSYPVIQIAITTRRSENTFR